MMKRVAGKTIIYERYLRELKNEIGINMYNHLSSKFFSNSLKLILYADFCKGEK